MTTEGIRCYVGLDVSLTRPGVAAVDANGVVIEARSISIRGTGAYRLAMIRTELKDFLLRTPVTLGTAIEGPSLGSVHREFDLGEASGVARALVFEMNAHEPTVVPPTSLKKFAGWGAADKARVLYAVKALWGLDLQGDHDAADAFVLAKIAWSLDHPTLLTRRCEREVVETLRAPKTKRPARRRSRNDI